MRVWWIQVLCVIAVAEASCVASDRYHGCSCNQLIEKVNGKRERVSVMAQQLAHLPPTNQAKISSLSIKMADESEKADIADAVYSERCIAAEVDSEGDSSPVQFTKVDPMTLRELVTHLLSPHAEAHFQQSFFLTMPTFSSPLHIAKELQHAITPDNIGNLVNVITIWRQEAPEDFTDEVEVALDELADSLGPDVAALMTAAVHPTVRTGKKKDWSGHLFPPRMTIGKRNDLESFVFEDIPMEELARQLCLKEHEMYSRIRIRDLLHYAWPKQFAKAPHLTELISNSNHLTFWLLSQIILPEKTKDRAAARDLVIELGNHLRNMRNYASFMSVIGALANMSASRLHKTIARCKNNDLYDRIKDVMSPSLSYKVYRAELNKVSPHSPCVPYLGRDLTDIVFINDGNKEATDGRINMNKRMKAVQVAKAYVQYQPNQYLFEKVPAIQKFVFDAPPITEDELYQQSLLREPRVKVDLDE